MLLVDRIIKTIERIIRPIEAYIVLIFTVEITIIIFAATVSRYTVIGALGWTNELASYSLSWITFFGASLVMDRKGHLAMDLLTKNLPVRLRKLNEIFVYFVILISLGVLINAGFKIVSMTRTQLSAALQIPLAWVYLSIPLGSIFMFIHALSQCLTVLSERGSE